MKSFIVFAILYTAVSAAIVTYPCTLSGYDAYLVEKNQKCEEFGGSCTNTDFDYSVADFLESCQYYHAKRDTTDYPMELTDLADWSYDSIEQLEEIFLKYKHQGSYHSPVKFTGSYSSPIEPRADCGNNPEDDTNRRADKRKMSAAPDNTTNICNLSWAYAALYTIEDAYYRQYGYHQKFSVNYIIDCILDDVDLCKGDLPSVILETIVQRDIPFEGDYVSGQCDVLNIGYKGEFISASLISLNKGGLMRFAQDFSTMVVVSLNFQKLKFVENMEVNELYPEDTVVGRFSEYEPTSFMFLKSYNGFADGTGYWQVAGNILPCMDVSLLLPMTFNDTNANYAGIAGFAAGVRFQPDPTDPPPTEAPTTEAPTEAPTTRPPTEAPTTEAPTTEAPTTEAPTTEAPTTEAPTTEAPTTEAPTTEAPTTEAPTTEAPTTEAPTTEVPTTYSPLAFIFDPFNVTKHTQCISNPSYNGHYSPDAYIDRLEKFEMYSLLENTRVLAFNFYSYDDQETKDFMQKVQNLLSNEDLSDIWLYMIHQTTDAASLTEIRKIIEIFGSKKVYFNAGQIGGIAARDAMEGWEPDYDIEELVVNGLRSTSDGAHSLRVLTEKFPNATYTVYSSSVEDFIFDCTQYLTQAVCDKITHISTNTYVPDDLCTIFYPNIPQFIEQCQYYWYDDDADCDGMPDFPITP